MNGGQLHDELTREAITALSGVVSVSVPCSQPGFTARQPEGVHPVQADAVIGENALEKPSPDSPEVRFRPPNPQRRCFCVAKGCRLRLPWYCG